MKTFTLAAAGLLAAVLGALASVSLADEAYGTSGQAGQQVSGPALHDYTLGLKGPDFCATKTVSARSYEEVVESVKTQCENCQIVNLTNEYYFGEAPWETVPMEEVFCDNGYQ